MDRNEVCVLMTILHFLIGSLFVVMTWVFSYYDHFVPALGTTVFAGLIGFMGGLCWAMREDVK